jgi:beta-galactosidase
MRNGIFISLILTISIAFSSCEKNQTRKTTSLNGTWNLEVTTNPEQIPSTFTHTIQVPGLVDMAVPEIKKTGYPSDSAKYYWYNTKFILDKNSPVCLLKIHKAFYGKKIYVNNQLVAEHLPAFIPAEIDIQKYLNDAGKENVLTIRLGTFYNFPDTLVNGKDFEKSCFISGIYDDVKIIQSAYPYVQNVQVVPNIKDGSITVVSELNTLNKSGNFNLNYSVLEHKTGKLVAEGKAKVTATGGIDISTVTVKIPGFQLWSPDNPFLYDLVLNTGADSYKTSFGLREFRFDNGTGRAMLNGKIFYMKGTNVPVYRFFEDSLRGSLPWNKEWVTKLNTQFKSMNWNVIRYHVGPAPDFWYDLADEMGILIQDEFAIWFGKGIMEWRPKLKAATIAADYKVWMRERWNHPCVVIWDAQNETVTDETGKAINMVRHLDLSNRPWDNGWSRPQAATDAIESHPYLFHPYGQKNAKIPKEGIIKSLLSVHQRLPDNDPGNYDRVEKDKNFTNVRFVNEYGWLWVNRDGSATTLSENVYKYLYGDTVTNAQRLYLYARLEAMLTEYWRCQRTNTGVMHFAGLTYSRPREPRGQTSDNFVSPVTLEFEPNFLKYVKPAFADVALMIDLWEKEYKAGSEIDVPVEVINDLYSDWQGEIVLTLSASGQNISTQTEALTVKSLGKEVRIFKLKVPAINGKYELQATLKLNSEAIFSLRDMVVK